MRLSRSFVVLNLVVLVLLTSVTRADWINLTDAETSPNIAEITVFDDHVRIALEVYVGDLDQFEDLVPDELLRDGGADRPPLDARLQQFSETGLRVLTGTGERLRARLQLAEPRMRVDRKPPFAGMIEQRKTGTPIGVRPPQ